MGAQSAGGRIGWVSYDTQTCATPEASTERLLQNAHGYAAARKGARYGIASILTFVLAAIVLPIGGYRPYSVGSGGNIKN
jgi:hypothetical protein